MFLHVLLLCSTAVETAAAAVVLPTAELLCPTLFVPVFRGIREICPLARHNVQAFTSIGKCDCFSRIRVDFSTSTTR